jgi:hypothetical protein
MSVKSIGELFTKTPTKKKKSKNKCFHWSTVIYNREKIKGLLKLKNYEETKKDITSILQICSGYSPYTIKNEIQKTNSSTLL